MPKMKATAIKGKMRETQRILHQKKIANPKNPKMLTQILNRLARMKLQRAIQLAAKNKLSISRAKILKQAGSKLELNQA